MDAPQQPGPPVSGKAMMAVTAVLVAVMLVLAWLAGPFGREQLIKQQPLTHWRASAGP